MGGIYLHVGPAASGHICSQHTVIYNFVSYSVISCVSLLAVAIATREEETTVSFTAHLFNVA